MIHPGQRAKTKVSHNICNAAYIRVVRYSRHRSLRMAFSPHQLHKTTRMMMSGFRRVVTPVVLLLLLSALLLLLHVQPSSCALTDTEKVYLDVPSPNGARESLKYITSKPHVAGTPGDHEVNEHSSTEGWQSRGWFSRRGGVIANSISYPSSPLSK